MTHIDQLVLPRVLRHMEQHSWKVELTHLIPGELPEIFLVWVKVGVVPAVNIASEIAKPDIISSISQKESWDSGRDWVESLLKRKKEVLQNRVVSILSLISSYQKPCSCAQ